MLLFLLFSCKLTATVSSTVSEQYPVDLLGCSRFDGLNVSFGVQGNEKNWSPRFQTPNHVLGPRPFYAPTHIQVKFSISASEGLRRSREGSK